MTVARRITIKLIVLAFAAIAGAVATLWAITDLNHLTTATREEYLDLQIVRRAENRIDDAQVALGRGAVGDAISAIDEARTLIREFSDAQKANAVVTDAQHVKYELASAALAAEGLLSIRAEIGDPAAASQPYESLAGRIQSLHAVESGLQSLAKRIEMRVGDVMDTTARHVRRTVWAVVAVLMCILIGTIIADSFEYRAIIHPLRDLRGAASALAGGKFETQLEAAGDQEFVELQRDFNHMAREFRSLYTDLEQRVAEKSKQLALSERLASVGFLAAGVAHEINNPLGIMTGYAESILRRMNAVNGNHGAPVGDLQHDLEVIRDEAFRCKRITQRLLDLCHMGGGSRTNVPVWGMIEDVVDLVRNAPLGRERTIAVAGDKNDTLAVNASEQELKQVLLNLMINALQATPPTQGRVDIRANRHNGWVDVEVRDNGCGMSSEVLQHVFEPFFTFGKERTGTGLGLAISHAIVEQHGGRLAAASDGPQRGSVFTIRLPAYGGAA